MRSHAPCMGATALSTPDATLHDKCQPVEAPHPRPPPLTINHLVDLMKDPATPKAPPQYRSAWPAAAPQHCPAQIPRAAPPQPPLQCPEVLHVNSPCAHQRPGTPHINHPCTQPPSAAAPSLADLITALQQPAPSAQAMQAAELVVEEQRGGRNACSHAAPTHLPLSSPPTLSADVHTAPRDARSPDATSARQSAAIVDSMLAHCSVGRSGYDSAATHSTAVPCAARSDARPPAAVEPSCGPHHIPSMSHGVVALDGCTSRRSMPACTGTQHASTLLDTASREMEQPADANGERVGRHETATMRGALKRGVEEMCKSVDSQDRRTGALRRRDPSHTCDRDQTRAIRQTEHPVRPGRAARREAEGNGRNHSIKGKQCCEADRGTRVGCNRLSRTSRRDHRRGDRETSANKHCRGRSRSLRSRSRNPGCGRTVLSACVGRSGPEDVGSGHRGPDSSGQPGSPSLPLWQSVGSGRRTLREMNECTHACSSAHTLPCSSPPLHGERRARQASTASMCSKTQPCRGLAGVAISRTGGGGVGRRVRPAVGQDLCWGGGYRRLAPPPPPRGAALPPVDELFGV
jgi:hypothetical protein